MINSIKVIQSLGENGVEFVLVGGMAIRSHGSAYVTQDIDICYLRARENLKRMVKALTPFNPRPRNFPKELPFFFDEQTLLIGTNFTFETDIGDIDLLGEVSGVGNFEDALADSVKIQVHGFETNVLSLNGLIKAKRAAGRAKDLLVLPELEALREALSDEE